VRGAQQLICGAAHLRASGWLPGWILSEIRGVNFANVPAVFVDPGQKQVLAGVQLVVNNAGGNEGADGNAGNNEGGGLNAGGGVNAGGGGNEGGNAGPDGNVTFQPFRIPTGFWHHRTGSNRLRGKKEQREKAELSTKERMTRQRAEERRLVDEGKRQAMHEVCAACACVRVVVCS